ncbi:MAG: MFS transporter [Christensenellales bacterium]|jgi:MFS family permease
MQMLRRLRKNPMVDTFLSLKGNARVCIWAEPLWALPYRLYIPYVTLYMAALGLTAAEIGIIATVTFIVNIISSILSGIAADKMGRRRATLVFDLLSQTMPAILWMLSQNFTWFLVASLFYGMWRFSVCSWGLLLTEGLEDDLVVRCYSLASLTGAIVSFIAPVSKFFVGHFGLVPTMRFYYGFTAVLFTLKFILVYRYSTETEMGLRRMEETKNLSVWQMIKGCVPVCKKLIFEKRMLLVLGLLAILTIVDNLNVSFWSLYLKNDIGFAKDNVALLSTFKSLITLFAILWIVPKIRLRTFERPVVVCWLLFAASQTLFILTPKGALLIPVLLFSIALEAAALSVLAPVIESLLIVNADPVEKARVMGMVYAVMLLPATFFPTFAGFLMDRFSAAPFCINLCLFALGIACTIALSKMNHREE